MKKQSSTTIIFIFLVSLAAFFVVNRMALLYRQLEGPFVEKLSEITDLIFSDISNNLFFISSNQTDLIAGFISLLFVVLIYLYQVTGRNNFMLGKEHGSARWGTPSDIAPFIDKKYENNMLFSQSERMSLNTRKTFRNNHVLVIGGSGSGKTRYYVKPNLMQMHSSYVITDPKGTLLQETGKMLEQNGYKIKVMNLINMEKSDKYNFFEYIKDEKDILKLINNLITNTNSPQSKGAGDFWEKAERAYLQALFAYVFYEGLPHEKNINTILEMHRLNEVREDVEDYKSPLDIMFDELKEENPNHFACKQYDIYRIAAGKTAKSILVSVGVRLSPFYINQVSELLSEDELDLERIGEEKTALFVIIPDSDKTFNFIAAIMYQQMFDILLYKADNDYKGGRLPIHLRFLLDEFANIGQIPNFDTYIATIRSREMSVNVIIQNLAQLKALYKDTWETITGNCDTLLFLGGKEQSTLEYISKMCDKTTIDLRTTNVSKGQNGSYTLNNQVLGRALITPGEVGLLKGDECIVQVRGAYPFKSQKTKLEKHKLYKKLADYDEQNIYNRDNDVQHRASRIFHNIKEIQQIN